MNANWKEDKEFSRWITRHERVVEQATSKHTTSKQAAKLKQVKYKPPLAELKMLEREKE